VCRIKKEEEFFSKCIVKEKDVKAMERALSFEYHVKRWKRKTPL